MMKVDVDENTHGYTHPSLRRLRNELSRRIDHRVGVYQIQTDDICCGYLIIDYSNNEATWSGDGFRTDNGGEGGSGYRAAGALLRLFNTQYEVICTKPMFPHWKATQEQFDKIIGDNGLGSEEMCPKYPLSDRYPDYQKCDSKTPSFREGIQNRQIT